MFLYNLKYRAHHSRVLKEIINIQISLPSNIPDKLKHCGFITITLWKK